MNNQLLVPGACVGTPEGLGFVQRSEHWSDITVGASQVLVHIVLVGQRTPIVVNVSDCKLMARWR